MNKIPVTNDTDHNMHIGGSVLRPGETQLVEPHLVPPGMGEVSTQASDEPPVDPVLELQKRKGDIVIAELTALSLDDLHALEALEASASKPRKGVLEAITAEHLRRASTEGDKDPADNEGDE
jgi:hypothetical protein